MICKNGFNNLESLKEYLIKIGQFFKYLLFLIFAVMIIKNISKNNENNLFWKIVVGVLVGIILFFLVLIIIPYKTTWKFYIEETEEPLIGRVYLDEEYLGETDSTGTIKILDDLLYRGEISLYGTYNEKDFLYYWDLEKEDLEYSEMEWYVTQDEIKNLEFDTNKINTSQIEDKIFELINEERAKENLIPLKRSLILDKVAREYSQQMIDENFFDHIDLKGRDLHDRLIEKKIFNFMATEDISWSYMDKDKNLAEETVSGWMKSPGHRQPIIARDTIWEHVGIGVKCQDNEIDLITECYVTAEFVAFELNSTGEIKRGYVVSLPVYSEEYGLNFPVDIYLNFKSSDKVKLILVESEKDFDRYISRNSINEVFIKRGIKEYEDTIEIKPGYTFLIDSNDNTIDYYELYLRYNPD